MFKTHWPTGKRLVKDKWILHLMGSYRLLPKSSTTLFHQKIGPIASIWFNSSRWNGHWARLDCWRKWDWRFCSCWTTKITNIVPHQTSRYTVSRHSRWKCGSCVGGTYFFANTARYMSKDMIFVLHPLLLGWLGASSCE